MAPDFSVDVSGEDAAARCEVVSGCLSYQGHIDCHTSAYLRSNQHSIAQHSVPCSAQQLKKQHSHDSRNDSQPQPTTAQHSQ